MYKIFQFLKTNFCFCTCFCAVCNVQKLMFLHKVYSPQTGLKPSLCKQMAYKSKFKRDLLSSLSTQIVLKPSVCAKIVHQSICTKTNLLKPSFCTQLFINKVYSNTSFYVHEMFLNQVYVHKWFKTKLMYKVQTIS